MQSRRSFTLLLVGLVVSQFLIMDVSGSPTPLKKENDGEMPDVNLRDAKGKTALHRAAENGHNEIAKHLIDNGALIDIEDHEKETPLHLAAKNGHKDVAELLVDRGALLGVKNNANKAPIHLAHENGHNKLARYLLGQVL